MDNKYINKCHVSQFSGNISPFYLKYLCVLCKKTKTIRKYVNFSRINGS